MRSKNSQAKKIRRSMGYSIAEFAELLGLNYDTYRSYDSGHRPLPTEVLKNIQDAKNRDVKFFSSLPARVDKALGKKGCPNAARVGEW